MKLKYIFPLLIGITIATLSGCKIASPSSELSPKTDRENNAASTPPTYTTITAEEAKAMIDLGDNLIILDVRTEEEYQEGHIESSILIPNTELLDEAEEALTDKNATILIYCRSGRRSALAAADLVSLGYTNVYDFGGIIDWEYDIVTD